MLNNLNLEEFVKEYNKIHDTDFSSEVLKKILDSGKMPEFVGTSIQLVMETDPIKQEEISSKLMSMLKEHV